MLIQTEKQRLKQFEKSLNDKIRMLGGLSEEKILKNYGSYGRITIGGEMRGYQEIRRLLYDTYPELKLQERN